MHDSPGLVISPAGENQVKFGKEPALRWVGLFIFRISTRFALHSPEES